MKRKKLLLVFMLFLINISLTNCGYHKVDTSRNAYASAVREPLTEWEAGMENCEIQEQPYQSICKDLFISQYQTKFGISIE